MPDQKRPKKKDQAVNLDTIGLEVGNKPPQALDVEEAVLGALLTEPDCIDMVMSELNPSCFYDPRHKIIFEAMSSLVLSHDPVDIVSVSTILRAQDNLEAVGGIVVLTDLSQNIGSAAHVEFYCKILKQKSIQRDLIKASHTIIRQAFDDSVKVDDLISNSQDYIYDAIKSSTRKEVQEIGHVINTTIKMLEERQGQTGYSGVPSGYPSIDKVTQGWQASDLIILAARPSVGKTAFSLNLARNAAVQFHMPVAFFSLEMSAEQLVKRMMTTETQLHPDKIKGGVKLEEYEWKQLEVKIANLAASPLYIDDTPSMPINEFRTKLKNLVTSKGVRLAIVDYLQLMQGPAELRGFREQEVAAISRTLKATAKELNIPIIALSQLSRNSVNRQGSGGRPLLSDLRESGSIEQDADMVVFLHRPDFLGLSENPEDQGKAQVIIAKHRNGSVCDIEMRFIPDQVKFVDPEESLGAQMDEIGSRMNDDFGPSSSDFGPAGGFDDFGPNSQF